MQTHQSSLTHSIMIPDDGIIVGIQHSPKICVDYLSHEWKEDDIWNSWKVMSKQKKALTNGIRLENASWRTWTKQKFNLKTVNPEKLNWLKDSDVTWLYGPLHTGSDHNETLPKSSCTDDIPSTKSCLKKKSISEVLQPMVKGYGYGSLVTSNSDTQLYKKERDSDSDSSDCETASTCSSTCSSMSGPPTPTTEPIESIWSQNNRKIQFNDRVEQCIAVDSEEDNVELYDSYSSDDGGIVMKISSKKGKDFSTICKLAPTKLKEDRIYNNEYSSLYSLYGRRSSNSNSSSNKSSTTTTSNSWMEDEDDMDLDLFDFEQPRIPQTTPSHYHFGRIIPQTNDDDEDDSIVEKIVHWVLSFNVFSSEEEED